MKYEMYQNGPVKTLWIKPTGNAWWRQSSFGWKKKN